MVNTSQATPVALLLSLYRAVTVSPELTRSMGVSCCTVDPLVVKVKVPVNMLVLEPVSVRRIPLPILSVVL